MQEKLLSILVSISLSFGLSPSLAFAEPERSDADEVNTTQIDGDATAGLSSESLPAASVSPNAGAITGTSGFFEYSVESNFATITKYLGYEQTVTVPDAIDGYKVTTIGDSAFKGCTSLVSAVLPDSIVTIESQAFADCPSLANVNLPLNLNYMGWAAFGDDASLTSIKIPASLQSCYTTSGPFSGCVNLKEIKFEEGIKRIPEGVLSGCEGIESIVIPSTVETIGSCAFMDCESLKSLTIPDSVTEIEYGAFHGCTALGSVVLPDSLVTIGAQAFGGCTSLSSVNLPSKLKYLGGGAFSDDTSLTSIKIPASLESCYSGYGPFYGCTHLKEVSFEEGIVRIPNALFQGCTGIERIVIPETVATIKEYAFERCTSLVSVSIPDSVTTIGHGAFASCASLSGISLPDYLVTIDGGAFEGCSSLTEVVFPSSLTTIGWAAFKGCTSLVRADLPDSLVELGVESFRSTSLTEVVVPSSVTQFGSMAFSDAPALRKATFNNQSTVPWGCFENCSSLKEVVLPDSLKEVCGEAFRNCDALETIEIPSSVKDLGEYAFYDCDSLASVKFGATLTSISRYAFGHCDSLEEVSVPYAVSEICEKAFTECVKLKSVTIPLATVTIADDAFSYPKKMTIYGVENSYAQKYAASKNIKFVAVKVAATKLTLDKSKVNLQLGESIRLTANVEPADYVGGVTWVSSNNQVAKVSSDGLVEAGAQGKATITVSAGSVIASCEIVVGNDGGNGSDDGGSKPGDSGAGDGSGGDTGDNKGDSGSTDKGDSGNGGDGSDKGNSGDSGSHKGDGDSGNSGNGDNSGGANDGKNDGSDSGNDGNKGDGDDSGDNGDGTTDATTIDRVSGNEAYNTAVEIAKQTYDKSEWVIIAQSKDFADAMSASGLAGALSAPILLADPDTGLYEDAQEEIRALGATKAYVIGGPGAIRCNIGEQLSNLGITNITDDGNDGSNSAWRIWGYEAADTSVVCANKIASLGGSTEYAIVAMSDNFQDALSMSSFAYAYKVPIILETSGVTSADRALPQGSLGIVNAASKQVFVAGGTGALSDASLAEVSAPVKRLAGWNGFDTSNQIATYMVEQGLLSAETVCIASGASNPGGLDALAGAALAGKHKGVMLLANTRGDFDAEGTVSTVTIEGIDSQETPAFLSANAVSVKHTYVLGGEAVMPADLYAQIESMLG